MKSTFKFASLARACLFALAVTLFHSSSFAQVAAPESADVPAAEVPAPMHLIHRLPLNWLPRRG